MSCVLRIFGEYMAVIFSHKFLRGALGAFASIANVNWRSRGIRKVLFVFALVLPVHALAQTGCPAGKECVPRQFTDWCFSKVTCGCSTQIFGDQCRWKGDVGFFSYEDQVDAQIGCFLLCANYVGGSIVGPIPPENIGGGPAGAQPVSRSQTWEIELDAADGSEHMQYVASGASRSPYCPATFSFGRVDSNGVLLCEKPRICCKAPNSPIANPVVPFSQEKILEVPDISGKGAPSLVRRYNSQSRFPTSADALQPWGANWASEWDARLAFFSGSVSALRPNGRQIAFSSVSGQWVAWQDEAARLSFIPGAPAGSAAWMLSLSDDTQEYYDSEGKLLSVQKIDGRIFNLSYATGGFLQYVTDRYGRVLQFIWSKVGGYHDRITSVVQPDGASIVYSYEERTGRLEVVSDSQGVRNSYSYNEPGSSLFTGVAKEFLLTSVRDPGGQAYSMYQYDASGNVVSSALVGGVESHSFNLSGSNVEIVTPRGTEKRTFSLVAGAWRLVSLTRNCSGCTSISASYTYDANGYSDKATDFRGVTTDHDYDARGLETKRIEASNTSGTSSPKRTIETQWHADFRVPVSRTTKNAGGTLEAKTTWTYNTRGQATARCEIDPADATAMAYACSATAAPPAAAKVRRTVTTYCEPADVTAGTCPLVGLVTSVNGARPAGDAGMAAGQDDRTTYTYYPSDDASCASNGACPHRKGDLWKVTNALGQVTTYATYDKNGRVTRTQDANGTVTDFVYHVRGWLTDRIVRASATGTPGAGDATTHIDYDAVGNVKKVIQPDGAFLAYTYDDAHRLIRIADNLSNTIDYCPGGVGSAQCLDAAGNRRVEQVKDSSGTIKRALSRSYNPLSQLVRLNNAAGSAVEQSQGLSETGVADGYDGNGNRVRVQDGLGIATRQRYDGLNRLVETLQNDNGTDPATTNTGTGYVYDTRDNLRQVTDPDGLNTVYDYDGLNNLTGLHSPDTGDSSYTVDLAGNRRTQTDARGITSSYAYDALNRLTGIGYPTASLNVGYAYDQSNAVTGCAASSPLGRLTTMSDASGSTTYCYDRRGNVTRKKQITGGTTLTTDYAYTVADRLASITYLSGAIVAYTRDTLGRVTAVTWKANAGAAATTVVSNASYYPFGPLNVLTYGNGRTLSKGYDQDYAIDYVLSSVAGGLALNLDVDVMGNIVSAVKPGDLSRGPTPIPTLYAYDPLYRLKDVQQPLTTGTLESYTYNKTGDRLSAQLDGGAVTPYAYAAGSHRLASVGGVARTYDANGNTQTGTAPSLSLGYDARNRLNSATKGSLVATYVHNGRGERVSKGVSAGGLGSPPTLYSYDEGGRLLSEYGGTGVAQAEYVYLDGAPIAVVKSGSLSYIETDHLGTPRVVADPATNAARWAWNFFGDTFGAEAPDPSPGGAAAYTLNLRFPGQYYDAETKLNYNYFRDYEPVTGRYVESDPIGLDGGINTYGYAKSSPAIYVDQDGDTPAVGAALCFVPGVGWVSCAAAAVGTVTIGLICYATGACQSLMHGISDMCVGGGGGGGDDRCDKKLSDQLLSNLGIDGHSLKAEALGTNKNISRFDLCGCSDGRIVVKRYGCKGDDEPQPTGWNWK